MTLESDIIITKDGDADIKGGDFNVRNANSQNIAFVCFAAKGNNKKFPTSGTGLFGIRNAPTTDARNLSRIIKAELKKDGYNTVSIFNETNGIEINADSS